MSATVTYNKEGYPVSGYIAGSSIVMTSSGSSGAGPGSPAVDPKVPEGVVQPSILEAFPGAFPWVNWGPGNNYPQLAMCDFRKNGVALRGLKLKTDMLYGKRVVACRVTGFDQDAQKEIVEVVNDPEINEFLRRSNINIFRNRAVTDFVYWGMFFPIFLMNPDRSAISMVAHDKASKFRFAPMDMDLGRIDSVFRSANWPFPYIGGYEEIKAIDAYNSYLEVDRIRYEKNTYKYVFPVVSYDVMNDYYFVTIQESLRLNGTLQNSNDIPAIVKSMIKNVSTIKYHIRIPLSYWKGLYPDWDRKQQADKDGIVNAKLDEIDKFLSGKDNQMKAFISHYAVDQNTGKEVAGWEIIAIDDKMRYDAWNSVDTATTAQILFSIGINPAIFGLGVPGGANTGGGNNGGSSIREAWLTMIAGAQGDRDTLYSWWPFVRDYNGYDSNIELRTIDQVLTTLDQGKGTAKNLS